MRHILFRSLSATLVVAQCTLGLVTAAPAVAQSATGQWVKGPNLPYYPVHLHLLPNGTVLMWPSDLGHDGDDPRVWNPSTGTVTAVSKAGFGLLCSGHTFLADGRLFVAGGHVETDIGLPEASIYNPATDSWSRQPRMNAARWYPTAQPLGNGDVLVLAGNQDTTLGTNPIPQVWQAATGTWRTLTGAQLAQPYYPYMFIGPNARAFDAGPGRTTRYLSTGGTGYWTVVANRTFGNRDYGSAVTYGPNKIIIVGGGDPPTATAEVINLTNSPPTWRATGSMNFPRRQMNATILPDGRVLAIGGTRGSGFNNTSSSNAVLAAEIWNPNTARWTVMASQTIGRFYHSTALLLPDGRVLSAGGNNVTQTEIYSPPYLFAGARPTIVSAPPSVVAGQRFFVGTPDATSINSVAWVRLPSVTHTNSMGQAFFRSTTITQASGGIEITAPNLPPIIQGHYMLFVLRNGVPSVARIVRLTRAT